MANLLFKLQKLFAGNAGNNGQFGSAQIGTKVTSTDPDVLQNLPAWENGWDDAVVSGEKLPTLEEMQAVSYVLSYNAVATQQWGIQPWDASMTYNTGSLTNVSGTIYRSLQDSNTNKDPTSEPTWWSIISAGQVIPVSDTSDTTCFPMFINAASGTAQQLKYNASFGYNASTNALTATTFIGALTGNASTSSTAAALTTARNIGAVSFDGTANIVPQTIQTVDETSDTSCFPLFANTSGTQTGGQQPKTNSAFTFNASSGALGTSSLLTTGAIRSSGSNVSAGSKTSTSPTDANVGTLLGSTGLINIGKNGTTSQTNVNFANGLDTTPAVVGTIVTNGSTTAYNTSSDGRLKENVADLNYDASLIDALRPVSYSWIRTKEDGIGFIAQELHEVYPLAVHRGSDENVEVEDEGFEPWQVDYSKLVPVIVMELKKLRERIAQLEGNTNG